MMVLYPSAEQIKKRWQKAMDMIRYHHHRLTKQGQVFTGKVISIKEFGAFLEFAPGKEGMVHISKISKERIDKVEDVLSLGDVVKVVCLGKDKMGQNQLQHERCAEGCKIKMWRRFS